MKGLPLLMIYTGMLIFDFAVLAGACWLQRLEKGGMREFQRAEKQDQYAQARMSSQWKSDV